MTRPSPAKREARAPLFPAGSGHEHAAAPLRGAALPTRRKGSEGRPFLAAKL